MPKELFADYSQEKPKRFSTDVVAKNIQDYAEDQCRKTNDWIYTMGKVVYRIQDPSNLWKRIDDMVLWADISFYEDFEESDRFLLHSVRTEDDLKKFIIFLHHHNYNSGYGTQCLDGKVVFKDGTWLDRCEYDGSEWWESRVLPKEPETEEE